MSDIQNKIGDPSIESYESKIQRLTAELAERDKRIEISDGFHALAVKERDLNGVKAFRLEQELQKANERIAYLEVMANNAVGGFAELHDKIDFYKGRIKQLESAQKGMVSVPVEHARYIIDKDNSVLQPYLTYEIEQNILKQLSAKPEENKHE